VQEACSCSEGIPFGLQDKAGLFQPRVSQEDLLPLSWGPLPKEERSILNLYSDLQRDLLPYPTVLALGGRFF
jgi:hypothetical protein